LAFHFE